MATGPIETHLHRSFNWENGAPGPQEGPRGRSANCGNGLFAQCVRLRSEINPSDLTEHMAHLVQAAVWTAGLDDRLADSGLIPFQFCKTYAPPVGVKGQISTVCLYIAGGNFASKDNFILFYLGRFDSGTVFWRIVISPWKGIPGAHRG